MTPVKLLSASELREKTLWNHPVYRYLVTAVRDAQEKGEFSVLLKNTDGELNDLLDEGAGSRTFQFIGSLPSCISTHFTQLGFKFTLSRDLETVFIAWF